MNIAIFDMASMVGSITMLLKSSKSVAGSIILNTIFKITI